MRKRSEAPDGQRGSSMTNITAVLAGATLLLAFAVVGTLDHASENKSHELYCEMTALYTESNGQHGWPAYKENIECP